MKAIIKDILVNRLFKQAFLKRLLFDDTNRPRKTPLFNESLDNTFEWIKQSFVATGDGGSSAYYQLGKGWKSSYPETTGYLIPTMYDYASYKNDKGVKELAQKAADWLCNIQLIEGGWRGLQVGVECEPRVFNSAMILDGLIAAYRVEKNEKYLLSANCGMEWILSRMGENGLFTVNNPVPGGNSADTLVLACLLIVLQYSSDSNRKEGYINKIKHSLDVHVNLQRANGWFDKCNFSDSYPDTALLHHIGYTLDGLIICSELLNEPKYFDVALKSSLMLLDKFEKEGIIPAFIKSDWSTYLDIDGKRASLCLTGLSQMAIVFNKIARANKDDRYLKASNAIIAKVATISNWQSREKGLCYGIAGSYPITGNYQKLKLVNWAAKYHAESVLLSIDKCMGRNK
jgi:hypothetical protein